MATEAEKRAAYYAENSHKWRDVYSKTPEKKAYEKDYYSKEEVKQHRKEYMKAYRLANIDKWQKKRTPEQNKADYARKKERMSADPCVKIKANLRIRLYHAVTGRSKSVSAVVELKAVCHHSNLRPVLKSENSQKADAVDEEAECLFASLKTLVLASF